jgi:hypothetical protein
MSHHLSLSLSRELWRELLGAALPIKLADGELDLAQNTKRALKQLAVRDRVAGLLEDRNPPDALLKAKDRAKAFLKARRPGMVRRANDMVRIRGEWRVEIDALGTDLKYGHQQVGADAFVKGVAEGTIYLLRENVEFPFRIEKRVGASVALKDIRYDPGTRSVIGSVRDLGVYLGDNAVLQLLSRLAEYGLEQQLPRVNPVPILKRDQVDEMVGPVGGPLKMRMGVEDLELVIDDREMTLKVRFGFTQAQLTDAQHAG